MKVGFSVAFYRVMDGTFAELLAAFAKGGKTLLCYVVPAGLYAVSDVMRMDVLRRADPPTYVMLSNLGMLFLALIWESLLARKLRWQHWLGLFLIVAGCW